MRPIPSVPHLPSESTLLPVGMPHHSVCSSCNPCPPKTSRLCPIAMATCACRGEGALGWFTLSFTHDPYTPCLTQHTAQNRQTNTRSKYRRNFSMSMPTVPVCYVVLPEV